MLKKKWVILALIAVCVITAVVYVGVQKAHTFTLSTEDGTAIKSEQIQPLFGTVRVSGDSDTSVVFTDIETGETYTIGYITHGLSEKIKLQKGKWYTVEGFGNLKIRPINIRISNVGDIEKKEFYETE